MPLKTVHEHLAAVTRWATRIREELGGLLEQHRGEVHFRPSASGVAMVGLHHERPQRGRTGIRNLARLVAGFDDAFSRYCIECDQGRTTPEKQLQSFLIADAYRHARRMSALETASRLVPGPPEPLELELVTDEIVVPLEGTRVVCDLLALRRLPGATVPVVIELKSARDKRRLIAQVEAYADLVDAHARSYEELFGALLGPEVRFTAPCERWIVWPSAGIGPDRHAAELGTRGIRVVTYEQEERSFTFCVGAPPGLTNAP